jgi:Tol biopolymer transport system component
VTLARYSRVMEITRMHRKTAAFALAALLVAAAGVAQQRRQQDIDLQAASRTETVDGDLNGAIKQYAAIVAKYKSDRAVTAMALVHLAGAYRKMGDGESKKLYDQVLKDYADQKQAVALARAALGGNSLKKQTNTLVWSGGKVNDEGTVSYDGRYISFVDWDSGDLAIHEVATGENRYLTHTGNPKSGNWKDFAEESAISRDSRQVAFSWWNDENKRYELRVANLTGEPNPRKLYDEPGNEWLEPRDWSPDGKSIVVLISTKDRDDRLGLVSVTDGSLRILRSGNWPGNTRVFFSPDGKHVGYDLPERDLAEPRDVFVFALDSNREIPVAVRRGEDIMMGWSPDGKRLLFASDRSGTLGLWAMPFTSGGPTGTPEMLKADLGALEPLGVTRSGALYYGIHSGGAGLDIQMASFDPASGRLSASRPISDEYPESRNDPHWSRDGKLLAYVARRGSGHRITSSIVIRSGDTGQIVRELPHVISDMAGWSPDNRSLLGIGRYNGQSGVFRIDLETGAISPLVAAAKGPAYVSAAWSADGKSLYLVRPNADQTQFALIRRDAASGQEKELLRKPVISHAYGFNLSGDGKYLAVSSVDEPSNSRTVLLVPTDGGETREVMRIPSGVPAASLLDNRGDVLNLPTWFPDGNSVLVRKRNTISHEPAELWQVPIDGQPRKLSGTHEWNVYAFRLQPNGSKLAYVVGPTADQPRFSEVWVLENFLSVSR